MIKLFIWLIAFLKELKKYGIVSHTVHPTIPPTTEYQLTELGNELIPIMSAMDQWGKNMCDFIRRSRLKNKYS
ncbi:transcriptional regulator [Ruminococcus sp. AF45-4BH]|nr:transcriptional regulator [Ruminococcus sp. AF45-4BH]